MESMLAAMPGAGDMAAAAEEEAGEDGADMAATQMQAFASGGVLMPQCLIGLRLRQPVIGSTEMRPAVAQSCFLGPQSSPPFGFLNFGLD